MEVKDVANHLSVHPASVRRYIRSGRLKATTVDSPHGTRYVISEEALHEFENQSFTAHSPEGQPSSESTLQSLCAQVEEIKAFMSKEGQRHWNNNDEVTEKIDALAQMVSMMKDSVEELTREVATMVDSRVKERDKQLTYAMKAMTKSDKKRRSLFGRA